MKTTSLSNPIPSGINDHSPSVRIVLADLSQKPHQDALILLLSDYHESPMGNASPLPTSIRDNVIPGLLACPNHRAFLAIADLTSDRQVSDVDSEKDHAVHAIGMAVCFVNYSTFRAMPLINIHDLAVHSAHQGLGIGKSLIQHVIQHAKSIGCCAITLEVRRDNTVARGLYTRMGFKDVSEPLLDSAMLFGKLTLV